MSDRLKQVSLLTPTNQSTPSDGNYCQYTTEFKLPKQAINPRPPTSPLTTLRAEVATENPPTPSPSPEVSGAASLIFIHM